MGSYRALAESTRVSADSAAAIGNAIPIGRGLTEQ
jgi:hypothetical protein